MRFKAEWDAFVKSIRNHKPVPVNLEMGLPLLLWLKRQPSHKYTNQFN